MSQYVGDTAVLGRNMKTFIDTPLSGMAVQTLTDLVQIKTILENAYTKIKV